MDSFIACHECDVIHRIKPLSAKVAAHCIRCGALLYKHKPNSRERTLAFAIAALILFILANSFPFLGLKIGAQVRETTLITGIHELYLQGKQVIAILVLLTTVLVPFTQMMCLFYILLPLKFGRLPKGVIISTQTPGNHDLVAGIGRLFGRPIGADKLLYAQRFESVTSRDIPSKQRRSQPDRPCNSGGSRIFESK
jgi:hypothetical protein